MFKFWKLAEQWVTYFCSINIDIVTELRTELVPKFIQEHRINLEQYVVQINNSMILPLKEDMN